MYIQKKKKIEFDVTLCGARAGGSARGWGPRRTGTSAPSARTFVILDGPRGGPRCMTVDHTPRDRPVTGQSVSQFRRGPPALTPPPSQRTARPLPSVNTSRKVGGSTNPHRRETDQVASKSHHTVGELEFLHSVTCVRHTVGEPPLSVMEFPHTVRQNPHSVRQNRPHCEGSRPHSTLWAESAPTL